MSQDGPSGPVAPSCPGRSTTANVSTCRSARSLTRDQQGLTDVVGQFLLIGISVGMVATLSIFIASQPAPNDPVSTDLAVADSGGDLILEHKWGEAIELAQGRLIVEERDDGFREWPLDDQEILDNSDVDEGDETLWEIGERVCVACLYDDNDTISQVGVAGGPAGRQELVTSWQGEATVGVGDLVPNPDFSWSPDPAIVGDVDFTDESNDPDGGSIQDWSWDFGDGGTSEEENPTHTYDEAKIYPVELTVEDDEGDTASVLKDVTVYSRTAFLDCPFSSVQNGSVSGCSNAQNNDRDPPAILEEGGSTSLETVVLNATAVVDADTDPEWTNRTNALDSNDTYAYTPQQRKEIRFELQNRTRALPETITSVVLYAEVKLEGGNLDDEFRLGACFSDPAKCGETKTLQGDGQERVISYNVTSAHPTGDSWKWSDINDTEVNLESIKGGQGPGADKWLVDHVWAEVEYKKDPTNELNATAKIPDIIEDSAGYRLDVTYCVDDESSDFEFEQFKVIVRNYNNSTWDTQPEKLTERCSDHDPGSIPRWDVTLSSDHLNCDSGLCVAKVRFRDDEGPDPDPSRLKVGYVRVVTWT